MKYINFSRETGDENEPTQLVLEGDIDSLREFHSRIGKVLDGEIDSLPIVKFSDVEPGVSLNGSPVKFCMRKSTIISKGKSWIQKDVLIAAGVVIICVVIVVIALVATGKNSVK